MAIYDQVMEALRRADASGNSDDAKRLAAIAKSMRQPAQDVPDAVQENGQDQGYLAGITQQLRQGASFGFADEVGAAGAAVGGGIGAALQGRNPIEAAGQSYDRRLGELRGSEREFREDNPKAAIASQILGGLGLAGGASKAVAGANTLGQAALQGAKTGAAYGGLSGFGAGEGGLKNRAISSGIGAGIGGALGAAIPIAGYAVGKTVQAGKRLAGSQNPDREAALLLSRAIKRDEIDPSQIVNSFSDDAGKPLALTESGGVNVRRLADQTSVQGGPGSNRLNQFLDTRQADQGGRILGDIKGSLSRSTDTYGLDEQLAKIRSGSSPLWKEAMDQPPAWNDRLAQFADEPVVKKGMAQGVKLARLEALAKGEPFDASAYAVTGFNEAGDPIISGVPTWRTWQAAKEGLDAQIEAARGPLGQATKQSVALTNAKNALLGQLDDANPVYKQARAAWAGPSAQKDAIGIGDKFMSLDPEQIAKHTAKMSQDELASFRVGAARALQDKIDTVKGLGDATKRIFNDNRIKDQIEAAFGKKAYLNFENAMLSEKAMAETRSFVTGNSRTAQRAVDAMDAGTQVAEDFLTGGKSAVIGNLLKRGFARARGINDETGARLAEMLSETTPAGKRKIIADILAQQSQNEARNQNLLRAGAIANLLTTDQSTKAMAIKK